MYPQSFWSSGQNTSLIHSFRRRASEGRKTGASIWRISFSVNSNRRYVDLLEGFAAAAVGGGSAHCYSYSNSRRRRRCSYLKIFLSDALISELSFAVIFLGTVTSNGLLLDYGLSCQTLITDYKCSHLRYKGGSLLMSVSDDMRNVLSATFLCGNEQHCETMGSDTGIHQEPVSQDSFLTMRVAQPLILCR
nr:hypothetical protein Iba_chr05dCG15650 [Ipomoea batatas]